MHYWLNGLWMGSYLYWPAQMGVSVMGNLHAVLVYHVQLVIPYVNQFFSD